MFQASFKGVLIKFLGCFKEVSRVFYESFKDVVRLKGISMWISMVLKKFNVCLREVLNWFQRRLKVFSRKIDGCSKKPLRVTQGSFKGI